MNQSFINGSWVIRIWKDGDVDFVKFDRYSTDDKPEDEKHFYYLEFYRFRRDHIISHKKRTGALILNDSPMVDVQWKKANIKEMDKYLKLIEKQTQQPVKKSQKELVN